MTTRGSKWQLNSGNLLFLLDSNLFFVLSIKDNYFFLIIIYYLIYFIFFMKHFFHKIIPNIYFDHIHIMCLLEFFSMLCMSYMTVYLISESQVPTITIQRLMSLTFVTRLYSDTPPAL